MPAVDHGFFDGACQPRNPGGHGGWGFVLYLDGKLVEGSGYIPAGPEVSNNVAEYQAALEAVQAYAATGRPGPLFLHGDSRLVVCQISGQWRVKGGLYLPVYRRLRSFLDEQRFRVDFRWVSRDKNTVADELSTRELRKRGVKMVLGVWT